MKSKMFCTITILFLIIFSFCPTTHAYLQRVIFDVFTKTTTGNQYLDVWIEIFDTERKNPPEFVKSIQVTAPDGTIFNLTTRDNWYAVDQGYFASYTAEDFESQVIPVGIYQVRVVAKLGLTINQKDYCDVTFLDLPVITNLEAGSTVYPFHVFRWKPVPGATYYRVLLREAGSDNYIYGTSSHKQKFLTSRNSCKFPTGDLKPGGHYEIQIEPRADSLDMDKRSRGDWVEFFISTW